MQGSHLHNWNELSCSQQARKNFTLGSMLDLLYLVRGYGNISFKDKVILSKNQKIHSEFITASTPYISHNIQISPQHQSSRILTPITRRNHKF